MLIATVIARIAKTKWTEVRILERWAGPVTSLSVPRRRNFTVETGGGVLEVK